MQARTKVISFLILLLLLGFVGLIACAPPVAEKGDLEVNLVSLHKDLSEIKMKDCVGCHDTHNEKSLDRDIKTAHAVHEFFGAEGCFDCHKDFDLNQESGSVLRKTVDMEKCIECHGKTSKGWKASLSPGKG
jgi:hypothetical protein